MVATIAIGLIAEASANAGPDAPLDAYESVAFRDFKLRVIREISKLSEAQRTIIEHHYFLGVAFNEIAQTLKLSKGRIADTHLGPVAIMLKPLKLQRRARTAKKKAPADIIVPRTPELDAVIAMCLGVRQRWEAKDGVKRMHLLLNSHGKPWTPAGLTSSFIKIRDAANIAHQYDDGREREPKTLHDARGSFVTHMRCLGYSKDEVAEMVGWTTDDVDRVAKKYADADRIAVAWLERLKRSNG